MSIECPKCKTDNPDNSRFCSDCGTQLASSKDIAVTETLEAPKEDLTTGSTFAERYQIIEELGQGGMGKVYRALDKEVKEEVALKLMRPEISTDEKTVERFRHEMKLARKISHRNVGRMYELLEDKGTRYITMEYVSGEDLKSFIRRSGQLAVGTTIRIAKQVCEGLAEAHRLGVVHRDLKPSNIMIDKEGNTRIMDFGIARSLSGKGITGAGVMIGTPEYMSPEQVEGKEVDQRSDIYSLGVILYEMVTGQVPFEGDTPFTVGVKQKSEIPKDPKELNTQIPEDLNRVILKCLEKDKEKRYQSAGEVRSELVNIEKGIPTTERVLPKRKPLTSREITVQFSLKKLFLPGLVIVSLAILAVIIWQVLPKKKLPFAPKIENSIAVISFKNQTGDKAFDYLQEAIPNLLITNLEQTGNLYVATWERMHDILKQIGKEDVELVNRDLGFELCRREGIESIVLGSFIKAGGTFATDAKVLDVETKRLLRSASSKGDGVDSILKTQIDELSRNISIGLGIAREEFESTQARTEDITTTSMEAYKYFLKGKDAWVKFYFDDARKFFEKAIELDPTFAGAYLWLGHTYATLSDSKARGEAYKKAKSLSQKATEKERLKIEASYASAIERDSDKYFQILQQIVRKYPRDKGIHNQLGLYYSGRKMFKEAIEEYSKVLELDPQSGFAMNELAYVNLEMGNLTQAIEYLKKYAAVSPGDANPIDSMAEVYFRMGRLEEAIAKYKEALEIKPDFGSDWRLAYVYALKEDYASALDWLDHYHAKAPSYPLKADAYECKAFYLSWLGKFAKATENLDKAFDLAETFSNESLKNNLNWIKGWILYEKGELKLSRKCFENYAQYVVKRYPQRKSVYHSAHNFRLGLLDLKEGHINSAKKRLSEMEIHLLEMNPDSKERHSHLRDLLQEEISLAEDSPDKAIAVISKTPPLEIPIMMSSKEIEAYNLPFFRDMLARAYVKNGDLDKAISEYERLVNFDPSSKNRRLIHPKYHYRLAKLYDQKGMKTKAIEYYDKFLSLWKDADPAIPDIEEARKRLAGLKD